LGSGLGNIYLLRIERSIYENSTDFECHAIPENPYNFNT